MTEKASKNLDDNNKAKCSLEGIQGRPEDCKNNPIKYPDNNRPEICRQCISDPKFPKIAESPLPFIYTKIKQMNQQNNQE